MEWSNGTASRGFFAKTYSFPRSRPRDCSCIRSSTSTTILHTCHTYPLRSFTSWKPLTYNLKLEAKSDVANFWRRSPTDKLGQLPSVLLRRDISHSHSRHDTSCSIVFTHVISYHLRLGNDLSGRSTYNTPFGSVTSTLVARPGCRRLL